MREIVELEEGDSIPVVRCKLEQAQSRRVALLVPQGYALLRSEVNLVLVRRLAQALALDLVLVTSDRRVARLARMVGLRTAASVPAAHRVRRSRAIAAPSYPSGHATHLPALSSPSYEKSFVAPKLLGRFGAPALALVLGIGVVLIALVAAALVLPTATVSLDPIGEGASIEGEVVASTQVQQVDYEGGKIPARRAVIEAASEEIGQTTGRQTVADGHATGEVVLANKTTEEVVIPKGTVVRTNDGIPIKFYTLLDAKVPGSFGATVRVPVMAFEPGPEGNVPALTVRVVEGEPSFQVDVLNDQPMQGGTEKSVAVVTASDCDRLRASLMQRLQQEAYNKLVGDLKPGDWIPPESLDVAVVEEAFDKKVDEQAEALHLRMKVRVSGLAVDGQAVRDLLVRRLEAREGKGLVVNEATLRVEQPVGDALVEGETVRFKATASALLVPMIDLREVSRRIAGQSPQHALLLLTNEYALRQPPKMRIQPDWWPRLPWLPWRIHTQLVGGL